MKAILAVALSVVLCAQPVYAVSAKDPMLYTGTAETDEQKQPEDQKQPDAQKAQDTKSKSKEEIDVSAPSVILMEASTGSTIYEKDADKQLPPASVTKIMTLLLIFDALESGKINLKDEVSTSDHAASMGGSQVFLEPNEKQTVDTMIKCISVASANDASVAMAEYIAGSEEEFVKLMNNRAKELGMNNTNFVNCCGLDVDGHLTTAKDIALMSRELITKYPEIHNYSKIWMENITHTTKKGTTEFGLTNTNKLIRQYQYATGLKTGSTGKAKYCVSATAKKDDMELIAVVMAAPDHKVRFADATKMLNYGFAKCAKYSDEQVAGLKPVAVRRGSHDAVAVEAKGGFSYVDTSGMDLAGIERKIKMKKELKAPVKKGAAAGEVQYYLNGEKIGTVPIVTTAGVEKSSYQSALLDAVSQFLL